MIRRYLKLREFVDVVTSKIKNENVGLKKLKPGDLISTSNVTMLEKISDILEFAEQGTSILGAECTSTTHLHAIVISNTLQRCKYVDETSQPDTAAHTIAVKLRERILMYCVKNSNECSMFEVVCQVAT